MYVLIGEFLPLRTLQWSSCSSEMKETQRKQGEMTQGDSCSPYLGILMSDTYREKEKDDIRPDMEQK